MMRDKSGLIIGILVVIVLAALFAVPRFNNPTRAQVKEWNKNGIECLVQGHSNVVQHIHPTLQITINGESQRIPADTGIVNSCMSEIHKHDTSNTIHFESVLSSKTFTLPDVFMVWGEDFDKEGYTQRLTVDGEEQENPADFILRDGQFVLLEYISEGE